MQFIRVKCGNAEHLLKLDSIIDIYKTTYDISSFDKRGEEHHDVGYVIHYCTNYHDIYEKFARRDECEARFNEVTKLFNIIGKGSV